MRNKTILGILAVAGGVLVASSGVGYYHRTRFNLRLPGQAKPNMSLTMTNESARLETPEKAKAKPLALAPTPTPTVWEHAPEPTKVARTHRHRRHHHHDKRRVWLVKKNDSLYTLAKADGMDAGPEFDRWFNKWTKHNKRLVANYRRTHQERPTIASKVLHPNTMTVLPTRREVARIKAKRKLAYR